MAKFSPVVLLLCTIGGDYAYASKAQEPSRADAERLIMMAERQKTADGSTVIEALRYAEKMRPKVFKLSGPFDFAYSSNGRLSSVGVCYWIGAKRRDGDQYCDISWEISGDHKSLLPPPTSPPGLTVNNLMAGRDAFLDSLDDFYRVTCINPNTHQKYC